MTLLVFEKGKGTGSTTGGLLDPARRAAAAEEANAAILQAQQQDSGKSVVWFQG